MHPLQAGFFNSITARRAVCATSVLDIAAAVQRPLPARLSSSLRCCSRRFSSSSSAEALQQAPESSTAAQAQPPQSTRRASPKPLPPQNPHTHLKIYVLPTLHHKIVFHPAFLRPRSSIERSAIVAAYILRKWRYQLSDTAAFAWHALGAQSSGRNFLYRFGNRITTRRAADEYFLKSIPRIAETVEFIYPASVSSRAIKRQLSDEVLANSDSHRQKLFLWALLLPSALYVAKFHLVAANVLFSYNVFRLNAAWRSVYGAKVLQRAIDARQVTWTASTELDERIRAISDEVAAKAKAEAGGDSHTWKWTGGDLHDEVVERLETELKLAELSRTYRRARLQYFVHGPK
ncbi:hypothetical protein HDU87_003812 [Geranomyces variabilis]|uniref:Uncharacterized protein n=1 Tax=Geranomyces variabilis TaxID=109894 RepID=A0AAD5TJB6_9FUNG|nr:hypothetical protein HDU87_003812 [Geranomyces variabilis]